jgi:hypothetical protein
MKNQTFSCDSSDEDENISDEDEKDFNNSRKNI